METQCDEIHNSAISNIKGNISESFIISKLVQEGYKVRKLVKRAFHFNNDKITTPSFYLNEYGLNDIFKDTTYDIHELIELFNDNLKGLPDVVCVKDGVILFVEIKSNNAGLTPEQEIVMNILKNKGFQYMIRRVNIDLKVNEM